MTVRWGTPCNTCGLDRAMCLGHQEPLSPSQAGIRWRRDGGDEAADDAAEDDQQGLRVILASVQELRLLVPDLFGRPNILVDAVLDEVEIRLCERIYSVRWVDLREAAA